MVILLMLLLLLGWQRKLRSLQRRCVPAAFAGTPSRPRRLESGRGLARTCNRRVCAFRFLAQRSDYESNMGLWPHGRGRPHGRMPHL